MAHSSLKGVLALYVLKLLIITRTEIDEIEHYGLLTGFDVMKTRKQPVMLYFVNSKRTLTLQTC
jgi:hypothetical protein